MRHLDAGVFEVTIPFKKGPWYTVNVMATCMARAESIAIQSARCEGFSGPYGRIKTRLTEVA